MEYQLIIKISIDAMDDLAARLTARDIIDELKPIVSLEKSDKKLQKIFSTKPPEGVKL